MKYSKTDADRLQKHIVMLLSNAFHPDTRVLKEARSLECAGYQITLICWDRRCELPATERIENIQVVRIHAVQTQHSAGSRQIIYLPQFWRYALQQIKKIKPDIIHCHDLDTAPLGYWYARLYRIPWIFDAHECYPEQIGPQVNRTIYYSLLFLERYLIKRATQVITVGDLLAQRFKKMGGKVTVVGNYQLAGAIQKKEKISRKKLGMNNQDFIITYTGGFTLARAIIPLIEATAHLSNVKVLLAGDGPQRTQIEAILPSYPAVHYLGHVPQDDVLSYMALSDVIYYGLYATSGNSQYSSPNALYNALMVGKPLLTTHLGEIAYIVDSEKCGLVIEKPESHQIVQAINQLLDINTRTNLARNARKLAMNKYNWTIAESKLLEVYKLIGQHE